MQRRKSKMDVFVSSVLSLALDVVTQLRSTMAAMKLYASVATLFAGSAEKALIHLTTVVCQGKWINKVGINQVYISLQNYTILIMLFIFSLCVLKAVCTSLARMD